MNWYKVFHILGLLFWIGGLLDLTRILGYHVKEELAVQERLSRMEFRMFWFVCTPGMVLSALMGTLMFFGGGGIDVYFGGHGAWFHVKALLVVFLLAIHAITGKFIMDLKARPENISPARFKAIHGITGLFVTAIVILAIVKPF